MQLTDYLNKYYATDTSTLIADMAEKFGVDAKPSKKIIGRWLFKYNQLSADWTKPLTHVCRGIIVEMADSGWKVISYPFDKFFNLHEPYCSLNPKEFDDCPGNYQLIEKADGTCIQVYHAGGEVFVSTLGVPETTEVTGKGITFEDLFWNTLKSEYGISKQPFVERFLKLRHHTVIFELCTSRNRIVTKYPKDRIYLLGVRELFDSYRLLTPGEVQMFAVQLNTPVESPENILGTEFKSFEEVKAFVEEEANLGSAKHDSTVIYPEGYVVLVGGKPIAKMKNSKYLALHSILGGENDRYVARQLVEAFFKETLDDIWAALSPHHIVGIDKLKSEVRLLQTTVATVTLEIQQALANKTFDNPGLQRKAYAELVLKGCKRLEGRAQKWASGYLFENIQDVLSGSPGDFDSFLKKQSLKTATDLDWWKEIVVAEFDRYFEEQSRGDNTKP